MTDSSVTADQVVDFLDSFGAEKTRIEDVDFFIVFFQHIVQAKISSGSYHWRLFGSSFEQAKDMVALLKNVRRLLRLGEVLKTE